MLLLNAAFHASCTMRFWWAVSAQSSCACLAGLVSQDVDWNLCEPDTIPYCESTIDTNVCRSSLQSEICMTTCVAEKCYQNFERYKSAPMWRLSCWWCFACRATGGRPRSEVLSKSRRTLLSFMMLRSSSWSRCAFFYWSSSALTVHQHAKHYVNSGASLCMMILSKINTLWSVAHSHHSVISFEPWNDRESRMVKPHRSAVLSQSCILGARAVKRCYICTAAWLRTMLAWIGAFSKSKRLSQWRAVP